MKIKSIIFFVLVIVFAPAICGAYQDPSNPIPLQWPAFLSAAPVFSGQSTVFTYNIHERVNDVWQEYKQVGISAGKEGTGSVGVGIETNHGSTYRLAQQEIPGIKVESIFCTTGNPADIFFYEPNDVIFTPRIYSRILCTFTNVKTRNPVLIVPGLLGTEIKSGGDVLWLNILNMLAGAVDIFMDPLGFKEDLSPSIIGLSTDNIIRKIETPLGLTEYDYADGLINEFKNQGYIESDGADATLFTFPYDWRYGVTGKYGNDKTNVDLLAEKIQEILQQTGAEKVDVVAHSLGGLIVKKYVSDESAQNPGVQSKIGKVVFVGVPNTGAPKAVKVLLQGDNFGVLGLNDAEMKKISANMPASYDLLPSQQYYDAKGSFVQTIDEGKIGSLGSYIIEDLNYGQFKSFITAGHNLNSQGLANAESLHTQSFDNYDMRTAGVDVYAIDGCKAGTIGKIVERRFKDAFGNNAVDYGQPKIIPGDGTVPLESATNLPINAENKFYFLETSHGKMLSQDGGRQKIVNLISGSSLSVNDNLITQDINKCRLDGRAISVFSPVNIFVTDQLGNKLGLAEDGSIINEIPDADFEVWGTHKFVYLPKGGMYNINLTGTDTGTFTLKVQDIQNSQTTQTEVFRNLAVTPSLAGQVNLTEAMPTTLSLNGEPAPVFPTATFEGDEPIDFQPPEVVIEFDPIKKDLKFTGKDNVSPADKILVQDNDDKITLTDQAGNTTEIILQDKNRKKRMLAELKQIKYNGIGAGLIKNSMKFYWNLDKNKNIKNLYQRVTAKSNYNILAIFDGQVTKIDGKNASGRVAGILPGLKIIKITTNRGDLSWSY